MYNMKYLKPSDIEEIPVFNNWDDTKNIKLENGINFLKGNVEQLGCGDTSDFYKLPKIAKNEEIVNILDLVKSTPFDEDPDSVDGMSTYEFYVDSPDIRNNKSNQNTMKLDSNNKYLKYRKKIRKKLIKIMDPIIKERINPFVRNLYSKDCKSERLCTPCYNFVRRYKEDERRTHPTHRDGHAFATVVISLSNFGEEYRGGIYVATAERYKYFIDLNRGDAIVHKHDLLHGVNVKNDGGERWSWILWYKDSTDCIDYSNEWYKDKAYQGIPVYQSLYATMVNSEEMIEWHKKAAENGFSNSMVKLARAYLKRLPSKLEFNPKEAERLYRLAVETTQDPHAQYGLAEMILFGLIKIETNSMLILLDKVIRLLEESAKGGNFFAMFNLGVAHLYGYTGKPDIKLANEWFEISGLPEAFMIISSHYVSINDKKTSEKYVNRAKRMGFGKKWRKVSRIRTGLGGASGVDINLPWPTMPNGNKPQKW